MATKSQRAMALILAVLFLATSVATGAVVLWQLREDNKKNDATSSVDDPSVTELNTTDQSNQQEENMLQGTKLADFTPVENIDSLQKIDLVVGTGEEVKSGATVTAHYTGAVAATGVIFQSSHDAGQPATFPLSNVIQGWQQGVPGMKVGGKRRLLIPAEQAYGANPPAGSGIPANADLVFDIELSSVQNP